MPKPTTTETTPQATQHLIPPGGHGNSTVNPAHILSHLADRPIKIAGPPLLTLTPGNPFGADGYMYFPEKLYSDPTQNTVLMGPGDIGVVEFTAPADAAYGVVCTYGGYQAGMSLIGPWGVVISFNVDYRRDTSAVALWLAGKGDKLFFQMSNNSGAVIFHSVQIFRI
jgi:hypothetical protein